MRNWRPIALLSATSVQFNIVVGAAAHCPHDNLLRCFIRSPSLAIDYCSWTLGIYPTPQTIYTTTWITPTTEVPISTPPPPPPTTTTISTPPSTTTTVPTTTIKPDPVPTTKIKPDPVPSTTIKEQPTSTPGQDQDQGGDQDPEQQQDPWLPDVDHGQDQDLPGWGQDAGTSRRMSRARRAPTPTGGTHPTTSLYCLEDLKPTASAISSACACFSEGHSMEPVTSTLSAMVGSPTCASGELTFPACLADWHPYNCGSDERSYIACECVLTTENRAKCVLGDYERDNGCVTSDDCNEGFSCSAIDCFGEDVPSICMQDCPIPFRVNEGHMLVPHLETRNMTIRIRG